MTKKLKRYAKYAFGLIMLAIFLMVAVNEGKSQDQDTRWIYRTIWKQRWECDWGHCYWRRWRETIRVRNHTYYLPEDRTRVYSYVRREDEVDHRRRSSDDRPRCARDEASHKPIWLEVLSTEHQSEENAREAARKAWMARAQWEVGGQFMSLDEAEDVRWRCGPSNAHDTASGRVSEAIGNVTGKGGQNVRCSLSARPCKGPRESDRGRR